MTKILLAALLLTTPVISPPPVVLKRDKPYYRAQLSPTCGEWREARAGRIADPELAVLTYGMWVRGYVTGYNIFGPDSPGDLLGAMTAPQLHALLDAHCARHPGDLIANAMTPLATSLIDTRPVTSPRTSGKASSAMVQSCREWMEGRSNSALRIAYGVAVRGYLTAYNRYGPDPAGDVVGSGKDQFIDEWIDGWCGARPSIPMVFALQPLIEHLVAERAAGRLPPGGMRPGDRLTPRPDEKR